MLPGENNSYGKYSEIAENLEKWSLGGLYEHEAFSRFRDQTRLTEQALSRLYEKDFGWPNSQATAMANVALGNALSHGFGFYMYNGPNDADLRRAILERKPFADVVAADQNKDALLDGDLLTIAVTYPEALEYLLKRGANPNSANNFGKTPLMYAAQYNHLEAAKLLLKAGADVNAATIAPPADCSVSLHTINVTPLHYAARYASAELIDLLLTNGAATFVAARPNGIPNIQPLGYPADWLHYYSIQRETGNPNMAPDDVARIESAIRPPSPADLGQYSSRLLMQARAKYASGDVRVALNTMRLALQADPQNSAAIADLPVMAMRAGEIGPALEGANRALEIATTPSAKAAAWFNVGLGCEKVNGGFAFGSAYYCMGDRIEPFVRAFRFEATADRATKLATLLQSDGPHVCSFPVDSGRIRRYRFELANESIDNRIEQVERIYVIHGSDESIDPASIKWPVGSNGAPDTSFISPHVVDRFNVGADVVTILEGKFVGTPPSIGGHLCSLEN